MRDADMGKAENPGGGASGVSPAGKPKVSSGPLISAAELLREEKLDERTMKRFSRKVRMRLRRKPPRERAQIERGVLEELTDEDLRGALSDLVEDARKEGVKEGRKVKLEGKSRTSLKRLVSGGASVRSRGKKAGGDKASSDDYDELFEGAARMLGASREFARDGADRLKKPARWALKVVLPVAAVPLTQAAVFDYAQYQPGGENFIWAIALAPAFWFAVLALSTRLRGSALGLTALCLWQAVFVVSDGGFAIPGDSSQDIPVGAAVAILAMAPFLAMSWRRTRMK
ncbi:hypothetical protein [Rhodovibrio sodomensis]|nr:hypothetical protein [Rhodovibrio sodomensis]